MSRLIFRICSGTAESGHYYSFTQERGVRNPRWISFNDALVHEFDPANMEDECFGGDDVVPGAKRRERSNNAYLLFYDRISAQQSTASHATYDVQPSQDPSDRADFKAKRAKADSPGEVSDDARAILYKNAEFTQSLWLLDPAGLEFCSRVAKACLDSPAAALKLTGCQLGFSSLFNTQLHAKDKQSDVSCFKHLLAYLRDNEEAQHWLFDWILSADGRFLVEYFSNCFIPDVTKIARVCLRQTLQYGYGLKKPDAALRTAPFPTLAEWDVSVVCALADILNLPTANPNRMTDLIYFLFQFLTLHSDNGRRMVTCGAFAQLLRFVAHETADELARDMQRRKLPFAFSSPPYQPIPHIFNIVIQSLDEAPELLARVKQEIRDGLEPAPEPQALPDSLPDAPTAPASKDPPPKFHILFKMFAYDTTGTTAMPLSTESYTESDPAGATLTKLAEHDGTYSFEIIQAAFASHSEASNPDMRFNLENILEQLLLIGDELTQQRQQCVVGLLLQSLSSGIAHSVDVTLAHIRLAARLARMIPAIHDRFMLDRAFMCVFQHLTDPYYEALRTQSARFLLSLAQDKVINQLQHPISQEDAARLAADELVVSNLRNVASGLVMALPAVADMCDNTSYGFDGSLTISSRLTQYFDTLARCFRVAPVARLFQDSFTQFAGLLPTFAQREADNEGINLNRAGLRRCIALGLHSCEFPALLQLMNQVMRDNVPLRDSFYKDNELCHTLFSTRVLFGIVHHHRCNMNPNTD